MNDAKRTKLVAKVHFWLFCGRFCLLAFNGLSSSGPSYVPNTLNCTPRTWIQVRDSIIVSKFCLEIHWRTRNYRITQQYNHLKEHVINGSIPLHICWLTLCTGILRKHVVRARTPMVRTSCLMCKTVPQNNVPAASERFSSTGSTWIQNPSIFIWKQKQKYALFSSALVERNQDRSTRVPPRKRDTVQKSHKQSATIKYCSHIARGWWEGKWEYLEKGSNHTCMYGRYLASAICCFVALGTVSVGGNVWMYPRVKHDIVMNIIKLDFDSTNQYDTLHTSYIPEWASTMLKSVLNLPIRSAVWHGNCAVAKHFLFFVAQFASLCCGQRPAATL